MECPDGVPPLLFAAQLNSQHGHGLNNDDRRDVARRMYEDGANQEQVAAALGVSIGTVNGWTKDLHERDRARKIAAAYLLTHVGWTQQRIADHLGVGRVTVVDFFKVEKSDIPEDEWWFAANACVAHLGDDPNTIVDAVLFADEEAAAETRLRDLAAGGNTAAAEALNNTTLPHYRARRR